MRGAVVFKSDSKLTRILPSKLSLLILTAALIRTVFIVFIACDFGFSAFYNFLLMTK